MKRKRSKVLDFYVRSIEPVLQKLEKERRSIVRNISIVGIVMGVGIFFYWLTLPQEQRTGDTLFSALLAGAILLAGLLRFLTKRYRRVFQHQVLEKMVAWIDPALRYDPDRTIPLSFFKQSGLFPSRIDSYRGGNYVEGFVDGVELRFSDLEVTRKKEKDEEEIVFHGTFIVTDFPKSFVGTVYVFPDYAERYLGLVGDWMQRMGNRHLVKLDSPSFEKAFKVLASDTVTAHYLLTPDLMERMLSFKKRVDLPISFSFVGNRLYIAIANHGTWFEPKIFKPMRGLDTFRQYLENFQLVLGIVERLKLNQKIWR